MFRSAQSTCEEMPNPTKITRRPLSRRGNRNALEDGEFCKRRGAVGRCMTVCDRAHAWAHRVWHDGEAQLHEEALGAGSACDAGNSARIAATRSSRAGGTIGEGSEWMAAAKRDA